MARRKPVEAEIAAILKASASQSKRILYKTASLDAALQSSLWANNQNSKKGPEFRTLHKRDRSNTTNYNKHGMKIFGPAQSGGTVGRRS